MVQKNSKILFTGSFINKITRKVIFRALNFYNSNYNYNVVAYFSDHCGFFGALACINKSLSEHLEVNEINNLDHVNF